MNAEFSRYHLLAPLCLAFVFPLALADDDATYVLGGFNDANGTLDTHDFFDGGSEFFKFAEVGWSPSWDERYFKNVNITFWQMDDRTAYGKNDTSNDGSQGIAIAANIQYLKDPALNTQDNALVLGVRTRFSL
jgi:hypothetical protein